MKYILTTDGASKPNPGIMHIGGCLITECGNIIGVISRKLTYGTNNIAEYSALLHGINFALHCIFLDIEEVQGTPEAADIELEIHTDSQLVANQFNGSWSVNDDTLRNLLFQCRDTLDRSGIKYNMVWGKRTEGDRPVADTLSNGQVTKAIASLKAKYPNSTSVIKQSL